MEKGRRTLGLTALFGRCLLVAGVCVALTAALWWAVIVALMRSGFVLPAYTAESLAGRAAQALADGEAFDPESLSPLVRWARFSEGGELLEHGSMSAGQLKAAQNAATGTLYTAMFPYGQYHVAARQADGGLVVLQYDYAVHYGDPRAPWPDFQGTALAVLLGLCALEIALTARHYARILRRDASALMRAAERVARKRLDIPFSEGARVREMAAALETMEALRASLSDSLKAQWALEQRRREELAALTHDLKSPLTAVLGNADLLREAETDEGRKRHEDAILREGERMRGYIDRLNALVWEETEAEDRRAFVGVGTLFAQWREAGERLCAHKRLRFDADCAAAAEERMLLVDRERLTRAVLNLLDNAVRFTPEGGCVALRLREDGEAVEIAVEDTGSGFTEEALRSAGYALYRGDPARQRDGHSGMGLCFARQTAQAHGGELRLANGKSGALARIVLPLMR